MQRRPRISHELYEALRHLRTNERRILVVGDLHCPFELSGYLEHCLDSYQRFNCNQVLFIGDIVDNHFSSYHEGDPNGMGGGHELSEAIKHVQPWAEAFPVADVTIGNHDRLIMRKAFSSSVPREWIKDYNEVLGTDWNWCERIEYDGVQYVHGEGQRPKTICKARCKAIYIRKHTLNGWWEITPRFSACKWGAELTATAMRRPMLRISNGKRLDAAL